jgi:hypothetical protein
MPEPYEQVLCPAPNKSLQRSGTHKVLGRGRPSRERTRALARPRAEMAVSPLNCDVRRLLRRCAQSNLPMPNARNFSFKVFHPIQTEDRESLPSEYIRCKRGSLFMSIRIPLIAIAGVLSSCALLGCSSLPTLHGGDCQYGVLPSSQPPTSQPQRCMTYAEYQKVRGNPPSATFDYKAEKEKQQRSQDEADQAGEKSADSGNRVRIP